MRTTLFAALLAVCAGSALAQPRSDDVRGTVPPGSAADGSRPADGAIKGGSILPGEVGGLPSPGRGPTTPSAGSSASRCQQLTGSLREQCLIDEQSASGGAPISREPDASEDAGRAPRTDPPPQVPR